VRFPLHGAHVFAWLGAQTERIVDQDKVMGGEDVSISVYEGDARVIDQCFD
jgi:hypothetical protein